MITTGEGGWFNQKRNLDKFCREYHDHGHQNNPKYPRGKDTKVIFGFNYRMTEMQGVIGKVQLTKLKKMINENKKRYNILNNYLNRKFKIREIPRQSNGTYDTFIFFVNNKKIKLKILDILYSSGIGTKNLPDAMESSSYYWDMRYLKQIINSKFSKELLDTAIAVPIWLSKNLNIYKEIGKNILKIL